MAIGKFPYPQPLLPPHHVSHRDLDATRGCQCVTVLSTSFRNSTVRSSSRSPSSFIVGPGRRCIGWTCVLKPTFSLKRSSCHGPADCE